MKLKDLQPIDSAVAGQAGIIVKADPGKVANVPLWDGGGSGMVAIIRFQGRAYMATRITPDWVALVEIQFVES